MYERVSRWVMSVNRIDVLPAAQGLRLRHDGGCLPIVFLPFGEIWGAHLGNSAPVSVAELPGVIRSDAFRSACTVNVGCGSGMPSLVGTGIRFPSQTASCDYQRGFLFGLTAATVMRLASILLLYSRDEPISQ